MKRLLGIVAVLCLIAQAYSLRRADAPAAKKFTLVIDAGHGGHDPGAVGKRAKEKDINLATALAFGRLVENNCPDVKVVYTRKTDVFVTLQGRAQIANKNKADLFVSVHTNALPNGKISRGAETYTLGMARAAANLEVAKRENAVILVESDYKTRYQGFDPNSSESYIIFEMLQDHNMAKSVQFAKSVQSKFGSSGRVNKGVHQAGFLVLRETSMPSVLIELGYITTSDEEQFLSSKAGSDKMGRAIYDAFLTYYRQQTQGAQADTPAVPQEAETVTPQEPASPQEAEPANPQGPEPSSPQVPAAPQEPAPSQGGSQAGIVFRVQFLATSTPVAASRFQGLRDVCYYQEGGVYKYTAGSFTRFADAQRYRQEVAKTHKGAFVVAFRDGLRMDINEARKQTK